MMTPQENDFKRNQRTPNEIIVKGNIAEVVLYNIKSKEIARTLIDTEDIPVIKKYKWHLAGGYVTTTQGRKTIRMQNIIMSFKSDRENLIDHEDRNKLNNRKFNFRFCTNIENCRNTTINKNNSSGYKGVYWYKRDKKWAVYIRTQNKKKYIGTFASKIKAALAYNKAALKYHGVFANLNEVQP